MGQTMTAESSVVLGSVSYLSPEQVQRGAPVTVIGGVLDIDRVGRMAGTIGYLMLTSLSPRYTRTYLGG